MVAFRREAPASGPVVSALTDSGFRVDGEDHQHGLWLTPEWSRGWDAPPLAALTPDPLDALLTIAPPPEFLLLGTGASYRRPAAEFIEAIEGQDIGVELMDSRAAARSWGMLRGEGRWIVAALLPLGDMR